MTTKREDDGVRSTEQWIERVDRTIEALLRERRRLAGPLSADDAARLLAPGSDTRRTDAGAGCE